MMRVDRLPGTAVCEVFGWLLPLVMVLLAGCNEEPVRPQVGYGVLEARVSGEQWKSIEASATLSKGILFISARRDWAAVQETLSITVHDVGRAQAYNIGSIVDSVINGASLRRDVSTYATAIQLPPLPTQDSLVLTRVTSDSVVGSFFFSLHRNADWRSTDVLKITSGTFAIPLTK